MQLLYQGSFWPPVAREPSIGRHGALEQQQQQQHPVRGVLCPAANCTTQLYAMSGPANQPKSLVLCVVQVVVCWLLVL